MHRVAVSGTRKMEYINTFKHIFKWQEVNKTQAMFYRNTDPDPNCPLCKNTVETQDHVYQCHRPLARQTQKTTLNKLKCWCEKHKIHPRIVGSILRNINLWFYATEDREHERISDAIKLSIDISKIGQLITSAEKEQDEIGWSHFFCRRLSKKWSDAQSEHNHRLKQLNQETKTTPISRLIKQLWSVRLSLWKNRNEKKYGGTQEKREENTKVCISYDDIMSLCEICQNCNISSAIVLLLLHHLHHL